jgi:hypothetical protein
MWCRSCPRQGTCQTRYLRIRFTCPRYTLICKRGSGQNGDHLTVGKLERPDCRIPGRRHARPSLLDNPPADGQCRCCPRIKRLIGPRPPGFVDARLAGQAGCAYPGELGRTTVNCNPDCNPDGCSWSPVIPSMRTHGGEVVRGRWGRSLVDGSLSEAFPGAWVAVLMCCTVLARVGCAPGPAHSSADESVAAVRVLVEELCLPAGIPLPVLGEEDTVRVIRPPWAGTSYISGPKGLRKITAGDGTADIVQ